MDVRLFVFLARQRSAQLQARDRFCGLSKRGLAFVLANAMFWQPLWAQAADGVVVSAPGTGVSSAGNGVPIIDIAAPNGSGLSHNRFSEYNVGQQGLILNNATGRTQATQLGGVIVGNANLKGAAASTILNEVNGANPSQLRGYTEVAGQAARVIVANPHGISCDGCGFINTPRVTLSTGKPVLDAQGSLSGYRVEGGSVSLDGAGLNADNVERFDIITRSTHLNAQLHARELNIITGRNDVDVETLSATPRPGDASTPPAVAIDSSALGGMYAGSIRLVGTEAGVGVRLAGDVAASAGDIQLDANGRLSLAQASASGAVRVSAASVDLQGPVHGVGHVEVHSREDLLNRKAVTAGNSISLRADGTLANQGAIEAGVNADGSRNGQGEVTVAAGQMENRGKGIVASRDVTIDVAQRLDNRGGGVAAGRSLKVQAGSVDNRNAGRLVSDSRLDAKVGSLDNRDGVLQASGDLQLFVDTLDNRKGVVRSSGSLVYRGHHLDNSEGLVGASDRLVLDTDELDNAKGRIASRSDLDARVANLRQQGGELVAEGNLALRSDSVDNRFAGLIAGNAGMTLHVGSLDNRAGQLTSLGQLNVAGTQLDNSDSGKLIAGTRLGLELERLINQNQGLVFGQVADLQVAHLDNQGGNVGAGRSLLIALGDQGVPGHDSVLDNRQGLLDSTGSLTLKGVSLLNQGGRVSSTGNLSVSSTSALGNKGGLIETQANLDLSSGSLDNREDGRITAQGNIGLRTGALENAQGGQISSGQRLDLTAGHVVNRAGSIAGREVQASVTRLDQQGGELFSLEDLTLDLNKGRLDNSAGLIRGPGNLRLDNLSDVVNRGGEISSTHGFVLSADFLDNSDGKLLSGQDLTLRISQQLENLRGLISARSLEAHTGGLSNRGGLIGSREHIDLHVNGVLANQGGSVNAGSELRLDADNVLNAQGQLSARNNLHTRLGSLDNQGGTVTADGVLNLHADTLDNRGKGLLAATGLLAVTTTKLDNRGGELSGHSDVRLSGQYLDNGDGGLVLAKGMLALEQQTVLNRLGLVSSDVSLSLRGTHLDNSGGELRSVGELQAQLEGGLLNKQGRITSETGLGLTMASLDNAGGIVSSAGDLSVNSIGALDNSGGSITSQQKLRANLSSLHQHGGTLYGVQLLELDLHHGSLDNQGGLINSPGQLLLRNLGSLDNRGGEISSANAFDLNATELDNSSGKLLGNQGIALSVERGLANIKGQIAAANLSMKAASLDNSAGVISSRNDLRMDIAADLINLDGGLVNATHTLDLASASLVNRSGQLLAGQQLTLATGQLENDTHGLIRSEGGLALNATTLTNDGGEISARGAMYVSADSVSQQGGRLLGDSTLALLLGIGAGDVNNREGLIRAGGALTLANLRDLDNHQGEISSNQSFVVTARYLDNSAGKLISTQGLDINTVSLANQAGLVSGWQGLGVSAGNLDNRYQGTLSSRDGDLDVSLSGTLDNSAAGALASQGALRLKAAGVDNRGGYLASVGAQQLDVRGGTLDNSQGGRIDSAAQLTIQVGNLDNRSGTLVGQDVLTLDLANQLNNAQGIILGGADLHLAGNAALHNQGGQVASQGQLKLTARSLDNSDEGTLAAKGDLVLNLGEHLLNDRDGLITSQEGGISLQAARLSNQAGAMQVKDAADITLLGGFDNQSGKLIAREGNLLLKAASVENRGGVLASLKGLLDARISGSLLNGQKGAIQARQLKVIALGGLDNRGGRVTAQSGALDIGTGILDNRGGGLYAQGQVNIDAIDLDNSAGGQLAGQAMDLTLSRSLNNSGGIIESDTRLDLNASAVINQGGQIRTLGSSGNSQFQVGGLLDNQSGTLEIANHDLTLQAGTFLNTGGQLLHGGTGEFQTSTGNLTNAGGDVVTLGGLTLDAASWNNNSVIQAGRLTLNVGDLTQTGAGRVLATQRLSGSGGNWRNDGRIVSDGTLDVRLSGEYSGAGQLSSLGDLHLTAAQATLGSASQITGGASTVLNLDSRLDNAGRLTSAGNLWLQGGAVNNTGTLGAARDFTLKGSALINEGGLLFSGEGMKLQVGSVINRNAEIYSLGSLSIDRDGAGTRADSLLNSSGSLRSDGDMRLVVGSLRNEREVLETNSLALYTARIGELACREGVNAGDCRGKRNHVWEIVQRDRFEVTQASAASSITVGGSLDIQAASLLNASSTIASAGNLTATLDSLDNLGIEVGETETTRVFRSKRVRNASRWYKAANDVNSRYWFESDNYNPDDLDGLQASLARFIGMTDAELPAFGSTRTLSAGDQRYAAVIQAGGAANFTVAGTFDNNVARPGFTYVGTGTRTDTGATGTQYSTRVTINAQLPPDLAQQQINPLTLPGFSLPTGQNGLFRISAQAASDAKSTTASPVPGQWTLGSASLDQAQHPQPLPMVEGRAVDIAALAPIADASRQLTEQHRQGLAADIRANAVIVTPEDTATPGGMASSSVAQVSPLSLPRVQGVPTSSREPQPHKYLVETNPVLTDLKQFMSSDYLLGKLGYDPDRSWKRLGDGYFEQQLLQQAVVARTGQRFIDGYSTDEAFYRYLMDNALASKDQLGLSLGVTLTAAQVAALTHDIVWFEQNDVLGEKVLVPVLYLAHAHNRLAPNGALISGQDLNLIAGQSLDNSGTLRASGNLSASAGQDLINTGLIEAGGRVDLLAGNTLFNGAGGLIAGRDVSLTSLMGDVINERTVTRHASTGTYRSERTDFVDNAARIEAANDLSINAGRDLFNNGGVLQAGRDLDIRTGRDLLLGSAEQVNGSEAGSRHRGETVTQYGSQVSAGRDGSLKAGRDFVAIGSDIEARRNIAIDALDNLTLASAANEEHFYSKSKKVTAQEDHVRQVGTHLAAGGDVGLTAGQDLALISSRVSAGDEAYLYAGKQLSVLAETDSDYSLYDKKSKGSFGSKKTRRDEVTDVRHVESEISTGGDLSLASGADQRYQAAKLDAGNDLAVASGGEITFEGVKDLHQESHEKSKSDLAWNSMKGKGSTDETLRQSQLLARGDVLINAADGLKVDIRHIDQQSVSQTIDAMVMADPQLAWLKDAEARGDVDWRQVKETHDAFKYSHSGLGTGAQLVIAVVVTYLTAGAASGLVASGASAAGATTAATTTGAWAAGSGAALSGAGWANAAVTAGLTSAASNAAISTVNNRGNLGLVLKDVTTSDALRGYAVTGVTAGLTNGLYDGWTGTETGAAGALPNNGAVLPGGGLSTWDGIGRFAGNQLLQNGTSTALDRALGGDSALSDALRSSLASTFAAAGFNLVGDVGQRLDLEQGGPAKVAMHAVMGGLAAEAAGGSFKAGAVSAGLNEALVDTLAQQYADIPPEQKRQLLVMNSQLLGILATAATGGDEQSLQTGAWVAGSSTQYNYLTDHEMQNLAKDLAGCQASGTCTEVATTYFERHLANEAELGSLCKSSISACQAKAREIYEAVYKWQSLGYYVELEGQSAKILQAFHQLNLVAGPEATQAIALPAAEAFLEALGADPESVATQATGVVLAGLVAGKAGKGAKATEVTSTGPKVPPKLQPFTNPPQGPVIPLGWVSRPGRASGSTIYYPPGTDPSAPGSTYIRLMPSGSTPVPGLENGYWISVKNGQPINPATGGTGTRGDTHVPLPPNTVPPKR